MRIGKESDDLALPDEDVLALVLLRHLREVSVDMSRCHRPEPPRPIAGGPALDRRGRLRVSVLIHGRVLLAGRRGAARGFECLRFRRALPDYGLYTKSVSGCQEVAAVRSAWQTGGVSVRTGCARSGLRETTSHETTHEDRLRPDRDGHGVDGIGVAAQTPDEMAQTAAYAAAHQNEDGGFAADAVGQPSSLGATNSGLRILKHVGGSVPDVLGCVNYVKSCRVPGGGFAPTPGGKPDVVTTALGLMAASELKINDSEMIREAVAYLGKNAQSFEEVRMAAAGLEAIGVTSPDAPRWLQPDRGRCGTPTAPSATGAAGPFATGGAAAAILRLGMPLEHRDAIVKAIKAGQRPEGGWSKDDGPAGPLQQLPDHAGAVHAARAARHRPPARASSPAAARPTAATPSRPTASRQPRRHLSRPPSSSTGRGSSSGLPAVVETAGFTPLVNGDSLDGWDGDKPLWSAKDGVLIGRSPAA